MNWYKRAKSIFSQSQLHGEYWIQGGSASFADGDIGDYNHEAMAIESAQLEIMGGDSVDWETWKRNAATEAFNEALSEAITPQQKQEVQQKWKADDGEEFLMQALREQGVSDELYMMAEGMGDTRNLAMKLWGWKIIRGNSIQTWTLTASDLREIADGLYDAYQEEAETAAYDIEVMSSRKEFSDVPWEVLSAGNPAALLAYVYQRY